MQALGAALDVVGVDEEVVEDDEALKRIRGRERGRQHTEGSQADFDGPVERRDKVDPRLRRHLTHRTFRSFASW